MSSNALLLGLSVSTQVFLGRHRRAIMGASGASGSSGSGADGCQGCRKCPPWSNCPRARGARWCPSCTSTSARRAGPPLDKSPQRPNAWTTRFRSAGRRSVGCSQERGPAPGPGSTRYCGPCATWLIRAPTAGAGRSRTTTTTKTTPRAANTCASCGTTTSTASDQTSRPCPERNRPAGGGHPPHSRRAAGGERPRSRSVGDGESHPHNTSGRPTGINEECRAIRYRLLGGTALLIAGSSAQHEPRPRRAQVYQTTLSASSLPGTALALDERGQRLHAGAGTGVKLHFAVADGGSRMALLRAGKGRSQRLRPESRHPAAVFPTSW